MLKNGWTRAMRLNYNSCWAMFIIKWEDKKRPKKWSMRLLRECPSRQRWSHSKKPLLPAFVRLGGLRRSRGCCRVMSPCFLACLCDSRRKTRRQAKARRGIRMQSGLFRNKIGPQTCGNNTAGVYEIHKFSCHHSSYRHKIFL